MALLQVKVSLPTLSLSRNVACIRHSLLDTPMASALQDAEAVWKKTRCPLQNEAAHFCCSILLLCGCIQS